MSEEVYYGTASIATGMPGLPPLRPVRDAPQRRLWPGCRTRRGHARRRGPGANEDEQGLPFVGKSGQLLDHYLEAVDLSRDKNVYIANIVKCRPPQNRDPLPEESAACMPWLRQQFQLIRPKIVVCLGRVAAQRMLDPGFSISRDHGKFFDKQGTLFMATYHPAALLRYPDNKPAVFGDFVALRQKITEVCEHTY